MRDRERFVQVEVHHVEAEVAGADDAEQGVQVGAVAVHQAAAVVDDFDDFLDVFIEQAERVGLVSIMPTTVSSHWALSASKSTLPRASDGMTVMLMPNMPAEAGFVPCAESGTIILVRLWSPRDLW